MRKTTLVVLLLIVIVVGLMAGLSRFVLPKMQKEKLLEHSAAGRIRGTIKVAGDNYLGYWFLTSPEFKSQLLNRGYGVSWTSDEGNYPERHQKFTRGDYDIIVLPISTHLLHGKEYKYPGLIPFVLSESRGADMVLGYKDRIVGQDPRQPTVNDLNNSGLKICVTPDSPSSFLLQIAIVHFDLDQLKQKTSWKVKTTGSKEAYERLKKGECDVAVLWEPDVSKALAIPGVVPIFGSDQTAGMIVDVFVPKRSLFDDGDKLKAFFSAYNATLKVYASQKDLMIQEMRKLPDFQSEESLKKALDRIAWFDLLDNCHEWYGLETQGFQQTKRERIADAINQIADVATEVGDLPPNTLGGNPYSIVNVSLLQELCRQESGTSGVDIGATVQLDIPFTQLTPEQWSKLRVVGKLRISPVTFDPGTENLTSDGQKMLNQVATSLRFNYPQYRILVKGHTSQGFTADAEQTNLALSKQRADIVKNYLAAAQGIQESRMLAIGTGGIEPLPRREGEGDLSYRNRQSRVEFILLKD